MGKLYELTESYLAFCHREKKEGTPSSKKASNTTLPNLAGFCRYVGLGMTELEKLLSEFPRERELFLASLEDEALNSAASPTVVSAYLKRRLGYEKEPCAVRELPNQLKIQFEHDIFKDGE